MTNVEELCETSEKNLIGSGLGEGNDKDFVDTYLKKDVKERYHFKIFNQQLWDFVFTKYGGTLIKRYYLQMGQYYS